MSIVVIAKNQTTESIELRNLGAALPAAPSAVTLTDFLFVSEIQSDQQLLSLVSSGSIVINDGSTDLTTPRAIRFLDPTDDAFLALVDLTDVQVDSYPLNSVLVYSSSIGKFSLKQSTALQLGAIEADLQNAIAVSGSATTSTTFVDIPGIVIFTTGSSQNAKRYLVNFSGGFETDKSNKDVTVILSVSGTLVDASERRQVIASANAEQVLATVHATDPLPAGVEIKALFKSPASNVTVTTIKASMSVVGVIVE